MIKNLDNKICLLVGLGRTIETLEERIEEFKDFNVVWCSMSSFDIPQKYILDKIGKHFEIVFDCSTVHFAEEYELNRRIPRIKYHLDTYKDSVYMCTKTDKANNYQLRERIAPDFNRDYNDRILYVEDLGIDPNPYCVSIHLFIASLYKMNAKEVILFGQDGDSLGRYSNHVESYYKSELIKEDKIIAGNLVYNLVGDTNNVNIYYDAQLQHTLGYIPRPLNCSPGSTFTIFPVTDYNTVIEHLKNG